MFVKPLRIILCQKYLSGKKLNILDIGSGSHSPSIAKKWFPDCHYSGVDISENYNNDELDLKAMDEFYLMDLTKLDFTKIPENKFDCIIMSHVIEHLHNGDKVIVGLLPKLKSGGIIYLEFPSARSVHFPSKPETLNFYDDPTHCRIFTIQEVTDILKKNEMTILSSGIKRQIINIILMPLKIVYQTLSKGFVRGGVYWDYYGFAEYVCAMRT